MTRTLGLLSLPPVLLKYYVTESMEENIQRQVYNRLTGKPGLREKWDVCPYVPLDTSCLYDNPGLALSPEKRQN